MCAINAEGTGDLYGLDRIEGIDDLIKSSKDDSASDTDEMEALNMDHDSDETEEIV